MENMQFDITNLEDMGIRGKLSDSGKIKIYSMRLSYKGKFYIVAEVEKPSKATEIEDIEICGIKAQNVVIRLMPFEGMREIQVNKADGLKIASVVMKIAAVMSGGEI